jgi:hypothetical protein
MSRNVASRCDLETSMAKLLAARVAWADFRSGLVAPEKAVRA